MAEYIINSLIALGILLLSIHGLILWVRVNRISDEAQHYRRILFDMITDLQNDLKYQNAKTDSEASRKLLINQRVLFDMMEDLQKVVRKSSGENKRRKGK